MKVFTLSNSRVTAGMVLSWNNVGKPDEQRTLRLGDYSTNGKDVPMFKKNVPVIDTANNLPHGGVITHAHPVKVDGGYALANPNHESDEILVVIRMGYRTMHSNRARIGTWSFDSTTVTTPEAIEQTLVQGSGSELHEDPEIGWHDALIVMKVGDSLTLHERNGEINRVKYESVETGLVVDTRVRMILEDYDAAPDGVGMYIKLNRIYPSRKAALDYKYRCVHDMYWGKIESLDGTLIQSLEERHDHEYDCD